MYYEQNVVDLVPLFIGCLLSVPAFCWCPGCGQCPRYNLYKVCRREAYLLKLNLSCHNAQVLLRVGALLVNKLLKIEISPRQLTVMLHVLVGNRHCVSVEVLFVASIMTRAHTWSANIPSAQFEFPLF